MGRPVTKANCIALLFELIVKNSMGAIMWKTDTQVMDMWLVCRLTTLDIKIFMGKCLPPTPVEVIAAETLNTATMRLSQLGAATM